MIETYVYSRKHAGEEYKFFTCVPEYEGEKGCCGVEITPYIKVETPENALGYPDYILLSNRKQAYTLHRYLQPYILKAIEKQMINLLRKIEA